MPWPQTITRAFVSRADFLTHENQYNGPYNKLLYTLFPADSAFMVSPNFIPAHYEEDDGNLILSLEITLHKQPVLILQVKPPEHLLFSSMRMIADRKIRARLGNLLEHTPLPALYGISAMGTKLSFYKFERETGRMTPKRFFNNPDLTIDVAPREQWDCDVLEADGEQRLQALVTQIKEACLHLQA